MNSVRFRRSAQALHSEIGGDVVALQMERGHCFGMEKVTADVWRLLATEPSVSEICDRLLEDYEVDPATCRTDVELLLGMMVQEGLIERVG